MFFNDWMRLGLTVFICINCDQVYFISQVLVAQLVER